MVASYPNHGLLVPYIHCSSFGATISPLPSSRAAEYWPLVMDVARRNNLKRIVRCGQIMGRTENDDMSAAQIFYPCMQCADIFFLKVGAICGLRFCYPASGQAALQSGIDVPEADTGGHQLPCTTL